MKVLYTAGPYRNPSLYQINQNIRRAEDVAVQLWKAGYSIICPHKNTEHIDGEVPEDIILSGDLEQIRRCDGVVFIPNWHLSEGAREERRFCYKNKIPIFYWELDKEVLMTDFVKDDFDMRLHIYYQSTTRESVIRSMFNIVA